LPRISANADDSARRDVFSLSELGGSGETEESAVGSG
jgi:hypothetical protein